jgi:hypothetical protein
MLAKSRRLRPAFDLAKRKADHGMLAAFVAPHLEGYEPPRSDGSYLTARECC